MIRADKLRLSLMELFPSVLTPDNRRCKLRSWLKNGEESLLLSESSLRIVKNVNYESFENIVR